MQQIKIIPLYSVFTNCKMPCRGINRSFKCLCRSAETIINYLEMGRNKLNCRV